MPSFLRPSRHPSLRNEAQGCRWSRQPTDGLWYTKIKTCIVDENAQWFGPSDNRHGKPEVKVANEETKLRSRPPANRGEAEQVQLDHLDAVVAGGGDDLLDGGLPALPAAATHDDLGTTLGKVPCGLDDNALVSNSQNVKYI